jgi:hypothetical protein
VLVRDAPERLRLGARVEAALLVVAGRLGKADDPDLPGDALTVEPGQPAPERLGAVGPGTTRVGELGDQYVGQGGNHSCDGSPSVVRIGFQALRSERCLSAADDGE